MVTARTIVRGSRNYTYAFQGRSSEWQNPVWTQGHPERSGEWACKSIERCPYSGMLMREENGMTDDGSGTGIGGILKVMRLMEAQRGQGYL